MAATVKLSAKENDRIAELADAIDEAQCVDVKAVLFDAGKIIFVVEKGTTNAEVIDVVCDAITRVYDTDTVVSNETAETVV